ncbi:MAG: SurA N-terminal domain-containing protein [Endomicrobium sp.]|uniref:peptidylprolyl isomerase n=1 Tax=Candidatus Endomicrobiellum pyrsonymphae TaxID=1408203 RepID=UPI0035883E57|nr:SurA N-terminal domain-containing protein [Endomicrobium sp.]MCA6072585.1 SurA N-terminal domain-containing protein [Endomicrobium sp.]
MKKFVAGLMLVVFVAVCVSATSQAVDKPVVDKAASQAASKVVVDKTLVVVNSKTILESEFNSALEQWKQIIPASNQTAQRETELKEIVLNSLIGSVLLEQEISKQKIKVSKKELQDAVNGEKKRFGNDSAFAAKLKEENMTMADFEEALSKNIAMIKLKKQFVDHKIKKPSETEAKDLYDKVVMKMKGTKVSLSPEEDALVSDIAESIKRATAERGRLRQIFVNCRKGADETTVKAAQSKIATIKKELQKQAFADIATQYSEDPVSKTRNGDLGIVVKGDLAPSINEIVFSMKVGDYTKDPIRTDDGYYFIKVEEKRAKQDMTFADVKNFISTVLHTANEREAFADYINALKSKASIKINKTW